MSVLSTSFGNLIQKIIRFCLNVSYLFKIIIKFYLQLYFFKFFYFPLQIPTKKSSHSNAIRFPLFPLIFDIFIYLFYIEIAFNIRNILHINITVFSQQYFIKRVDKNAIKFKFKIKGAAYCLHYFQSITLQKSMIQQKSIPH